MAEWINQSGTQRTEQCEPLAEHGLEGPNQSAAEGQGQEIQAYGAAPARDGTLVPACVDSSASEPGAVAQRQVGPIEEIRLWNFATGSAALKTDHMEQLLNLRIFGHLEGASIEVEGYASPLGSEKDNQGLSMERAQAVADQFEGAPLASLKVLAHGEAESASAGKADGARDRAVVLRILRKPVLDEEKPVAGKPRWMPGKGELENGFERHRQPPLEVLRILQRTSESWERDMYKVGWEGAGEAAVRTIGPSAGAHLSGRASQVADVVQGVTSMSTSTADAVEVELYRKGWLLHEAQLANQRAGYDPAYRLVGYDGIVLHEEAHDAFHTMGINPARYNGSTP
jgi:outer membrane protein OmpA-like peptidoglycan-associated protein